MSNMDNGSEGENHKTIITIDGRKVETRNGALDVMKLVNREDVNAHRRTDPNTGSTTVSNNHHRYLMYRTKITASDPKASKQKHARVIAAIGPDGRTLVSEGINYSMVGLTDAKIAQVRRLGAHNVDADDKPAAKGRPSTAHEFPSRDVSVSRCVPKPSTKLPSTRLSVRDGRRLYVRHNPIIPSAYQNFLKLFMSSNVGQKPNFGDGANIWRTLSPQAQASYAVVHSSSSPSREPALRVDLTSPGRTSTVAEGIHASAAVASSPSLTTPRRPATKRSRTSSQQNVSPGAYVASSVSTEPTRVEDDGISPLVAALDSDRPKRTRREKKK